MVIAKVTRIGSCRRWSSKAPMLCVVNTVVMATSRPFSGRPSRAEEHPGEHGRVPAQPGDDHPSPVADALGDVPEGDDGGADLAPENVRRQASVLDARQVLLGVLVALWAFYSVVLLSDLCAVPTISPQSRIG